MSEKNAAKKALLVIDPQNDFLWAGRKDKFTYDTGKLINNINALIEQYQNAGHDIIYIKQIVQNIWTNRKLFGYCLQGTEGAEFFGGLKIVSDNIFEKFMPDSFSAKALKAFIREKGYGAVAICGLDEGGCVSATAKGALKHNLIVEMLTAGIATVQSAKKIERRREKLKAKGVKYL